MLTKKNHQISTCSRIESLSQSWKRDLTIWKINLRTCNISLIRTILVFFVWWYCHFMKSSSSEFWRLLSNESNSIKKKKIYESKWTEVFNMILLNENHRMRHSEIKIFANVQCLKTNIHWFLTITFIINNWLI